MFIWNLKWLEHERHLWTYLLEIEINHKMTVMGAKGVGGGLDEHRIFDRLHKISLTQFLNCPL